MNSAPDLPYPAPPPPPLRPKPGKAQLSLRILLYQGDDDWIAHCLECDLLGSGATQTEALQMLLQAIQTQAMASWDHGNPDNFYTWAPDEFHQRFAESAKAGGTRLHICIDESCKVNEADV